MAARVVPRLSSVTVSVGAAAVQVAAGRSSRGSVIVQNVHAAQTLYVGGDSNVTAANGLQLRPNESVTLVDFVGPVWAVASGAATDTRVLETY